MEVGDRFPDFVLRDENDEEFDSRMLEGIRHIVYFYPRDNTPGCTKEAVEFTANVPKLMMRNIPVIGISKDSTDSHRKFIDKQQLKKVGAWGTKVSYGKETVGTIRSTFLIGKDGRIEAVWRNVKVAGHADKVAECAISHSKKTE